MFKDPDRRREYQREFYKKPEQRKRKARNARDYAQRFRLRIFARDGFQCVYCQAVRDPADLEMDHKNPQSNGGGRGEENENLITACRDCNRERGAKPFEVFMALKNPDFVPSWVLEQEESDASGNSGEQAIPEA